MSESEDKDTSKVNPQFTGTPAVAPRFGSLFAGTDGQRAQMRAAIYRNRVHRLQRKTHLLRPPH
jgi:hypothetical protein